MKPSYLIRRAIAVLVVLAALAGPAGVSAYPVIGDDPGTTAAERAGHDWMAQRRLRLEARAVNNGSAIVICPFKRGRVVCVKP